MKSINLTVLALLSILMLLPAEAYGRSARKIIDRYRKAENVLYLDASEF